jgi:hypothetical protein
MSATSLPRRRRRLIVTAVAGVALAVASAAFATTVAIDGTILTGGGGTKWDAHNETVGCDTSQAAFFSPVLDGATTSRSDGFDGGLRLIVDGHPFGDPDGNGDLNGQQLKVGPQSISGLKVSTTERALQESPTLRVLEKFKNSKRHAVTRAVELESNLGSDQLTRIEATSNGDAAFTHTDRWVVTSESADPLGGGNDPPVTHVLFGKSASNTVIHVIHRPAAQQRAECLTVKFRIRVPAHEARYLMFFAEMNENSNADAVASAQKFDARHLTADLKQGLSTGAEHKILNWDL